MDAQTLINVASAICIAVIGWFANELWTAVKDLRGALSTLREEVAKDYVAKEDYREDMREIKSLLQGIDQKLDRKADKS